MLHADEPIPTQRRYLPVESWRRQANIGRTATYEALRRGQIPHVRIGRRILIPEDALDRMLVSNPNDDVWRRQGAPKEVAR